MNKKQTFKLNENQLRRIVSESVKRVLREGYSDDDVYMSNYNDAMSDYYADHQSHGLGEVIDMLNSEELNIVKSIQVDNFATFTTCFPQVSSERQQHILHLLTFEFSWFVCAVAKSF